MSREAQVEIGERLRLRAGLNKGWIALQLQEVTQPITVTNGAKSVI
eukprot:COSAG02_NODE_2492_length_8691_cov_45.293412_2_plen_46_part_00